MSAWVREGVAITTTPTHALSSLLSCGEGSLSARQESSDRSAHSGRMRYTSDFTYYECRHST